jgi:diguanylate cyclase (GGDEF)-like protein
MKFIETLKLQSKLFFLFILITIGLITVGIMGAINVQSMKKNIDSLYFGSLVPVTELNEILQTYHSGLASTVYKAKAGDLTNEQIAEYLKHSIVKIEKLWDTYESHFKRDEELEYVEYVDFEIKVTNRYFAKIYNKARKNEDINGISINILEKNVSHIHEVVHKLIKYEVSMAQYDRKMFLLQYNKEVNRLGVILALIILAVLFISYSVFSNIQFEHTQLELTTKKLKRVNKKLENVSYTDTLTDMHNRRYFNLVYERELKRAKRTHSYITFMMLDIDFFKQYNDTYGHLEGDNALKMVAEVLKETLRRPSDFVFRLGGEEFGVLLTQTDESNSAKLARDIGDAIRNKRIPHAGSQVHGFLTVSIGVVCCVADDALNEDLLISRADEMLYEAKETGRDRYIITSNVSEASTQKVEDDTVAS